MHHAFGFVTEMSASMSTLQGCTVEIFVKHPYFKVEYEKCDIESHFAHPHTS